jgi:hypothetical protein
MLMIRNVQGKNGHWSGGITLQRCSAFKEKEITFFVRTNAVEIDVLHPQEVLYFLRASSLQPVTNSLTGLEAVAYLELDDGQIVLPYWKEEDACNMGSPSRVEVDYSCIAL